MNAPGNFFSRNKEITRYLLLLLSSLSSYIIPLLQFGHTTILRDWGYFNGLSHVVRSCIYQYHTLPIHNPWIIGGLDIFANPQSRIFSPFFIYDLFFTAPFANLFALVTLGFIGSIGFYKLMVHLKTSRNTALIGGILFIHASWFSLHFSEGHIPFGSFQLLGLALYIILRIEEKRFKVYYGLLNAFYLLDGGIYAFIYTNLLLLICLLLQWGGLSLRGFLKSLYYQWKSVFLSLFLFATLSSAKLIPFLWLNISRYPVLQFVKLNLQSVLVAFFDPRQYLYKNFGQVTPFQFHEFGAYIGIPATLIVVWFLWKNRKLHYFKLVIIALFFFWIGSGWLESINPWNIYQKIPVLNNAHVQSRYFIFTWMFFLILLCYALDFLRSRIKPVYFKLLTVLLVAEAFFVSSYPFIKVYQVGKMIYPSSVFNKLISNTTIEKTVDSADEKNGTGFLHYYIKNTGAKYAYEPSYVRGDIKSIEEPDYRGEIYLLYGKGNVRITSYTPGKINIFYNLDTASEIQVNTNYLLGWKSSSNQLQIYEENGLLTITPTNLNGEAEILYRPRYLYFIFPLYFTGLLTLLTFLFGKRNMAKENKGFNYDSIPLGFYDTITESRKGIRSFWHNQKFKRVIDLFTKQEKAILDIGCFSGTFLNMVPQEAFNEQVGVDILREQIDFANKKYGTDFRRFHYVEDIQKLDFLQDNYFDCVTIIEVIEHLTEQQIRELVLLAHKKLRPGGKLILTTPNYTSLWPVLEWFLNRLSDVKYEEQHITRFNFFSFENRLQSIVKDLPTLFNLDYKTTTHSLSPYLAIISYKMAEKLSSAVPHKHWSFPFGSLVLVSYTKL